MKRIITSFLETAIVGVLFAATMTGQTTGFTYQGRLSAGGSPATTAYDMRFRLFDALSGGVQTGPTQTIANVQQTAGVFTVELDFGDVFSGGDRFLEIGVSPAGQNNFTTLAPRQRLTSAPYSIQALKSIDSSNLGGLPAGQFIQTNDPRLTDARIPLPGSNDYLRNTVSPQSGVNFNIGGTGTANILRATTHFSIGGDRILSSPGIFNLFVGAGTGQAITTGASNAFFGSNAGLSSTTGSSNSFFGGQAGRDNTTGGSNNFFGASAGLLNTTGTSNSFFGNSAGFNSTGHNNAFFGNSSGFQNTTGGNNSFFGFQAGFSNTTGSRNTAIGFGANVGAGNLHHATAIGSEAIVSTSNTVVLGRNADLVQVPGFLSVSGNGTIGDRLGVGTPTPSAKLHVNGEAEGIRIQGDANASYLTFAKATGPTLGYVGDGSSGNDDIYLTSTAGNVHLYTQIGAALTATPTGNVSIKGGPALPLSAAVQVFDNNNGPFKGLIANSAFLGVNAGFDNFLPSPVHVCARIEALGAGFGAYALTRCTSAFSSEKNKTDVQQFSGGMDIIRRLNPVSFKWKADGAGDNGLNAEEVAEIAPNLVRRNDQGEVEDVKEGTLNLLFINAFKEQQGQIEAQKERLKQLQMQINELKKLICQTASQAAVCSEKEQ